MPRRVFSTDAILDAARGLVVRRGPRAATVDAIAHAAGVPVGSIYHRFSSIDELLARVWLRAARRSQERALAVPVPEGAPLRAAIDVALAMYDHCLQEPQDTMLLDALERSELLELPLGETHAELERVNDRVLELMGRLARELYGRAGRRERDLVLLALVDLPHGFARRQIRDGSPAPARRERLPDAVRAVLAAPEAGPPRPPPP